MAGPIVDLGLSYAEIGASFVDPTKFLERFGVAARQTLEAGSDVLIPGQALLCEALYFNGVFRVEEAPVLDVRALTIEFAEMLVRLRKKMGLAASRRGYFRQRPPAELIEIAEALYLHGEESSETTSPS